MKNKRFWGMTLVAALCLYAWGQFVVEKEEAYSKVLTLPLLEKVRANGTSELAGGMYYNLVDSTDTTEVDTLRSDTIDCAGAAKLLCQYNIVGITRATGANDSLLAIFQAWTKSRTSEIAKLVFADTLLGNNIAVDTGWRSFPTDSFFYDYVYFQTILKDSVKASSNSAAGGAKFDTNYVTVRIDVVKK